MEATNYYEKNLETGKLNVHTTKAFYDALPDDQKKSFKQFCLWSNKQQCWISKGKAENCTYLKNRLKDLGFEDRGATGERLPFEEQVSKEQAKAEARAERANHLAEKAEEKSDALYQKARDMADVIPFGQPIHVGHHSEQRDRNYRERIHNTYGKAFAEMDKAKYYEQKAQEERAIADGKKYKHVPYLVKQTKEAQKVIRLLERYKLGKFYRNSPEREISPEARERYDALIKQEQEK